MLYNHQLDTFIFKYLMMHSGDQKDSTELKVLISPEACWENGLKTKMNYSSKG